ncbi:flagellar biosynthetic protein FliR [Tissierellaceae bacterium HCP3S3_D8]
MIIQLQKLILILVRITAFIILCPSFSFKGLPNIFKVALSFSFSIIVYLVIPDIPIIEDILHFAILVVKEVLFGLAIGYVVQLIYGIIEIAGQLIDFQVGFSMASVYDPIMGKNMSNYGKMYYWLSICVFFLLDMHHKIIDTLIKSFTYVPIASVGFEGFGVLSVITLFSKIFELALNLAAPMIIVVLLTDVVLGIISKTVPQINVLMLGMPLKSMISFTLTMIMLSWLMNSIGNRLGLIPGYLENFFTLFQSS